MTQSAPEFKVLQSIAFLAVVLQSSLLYTMNQGNVLLEQSSLWACYLILQNSQHQHSYLSLDFT